MKTYEYYRKPTPAEIRFGEGAIHFLTVDEKTVIKKDGSLKKWFILARPLT